jgi:glycosyltransferase involved in cell wall biosynthesis
MRIGMILDSEINDDIRVTNEINILIQSGHEIILLCKGKYPNPKIERKKGLIIFRVFLPKKVYGAFTILSQVFPIHYLFWYLQFYKIAKKHSLDAIHAHDMYMFRVANKVAERLKKPLILDLHENYPATVKSYVWTKKWYVKFFYRVDYWSEVELGILSSSHRVIVLSDDFKKELLTKYSSLESKKFIRYTNVPDIRFFESLKIESNIFDKGNSFLIFYFGVMAERRGIYTLMDAVEKLSEDFPRVKLLLIGPVDNAEKSVFLKAQKKLKESGKLIYYPWKNISLLPTYINFSDVCVSPLIKNAQHESGVANKIFQYMYFKRPIVVSDCKPQIEIIIKNNCGTVFESGNSADLARKLSAYIKETNLIEEHGLNGFKAVVSRYNTETEGRNLLEMYNDL